MPTDPQAMSLDLYAQLLQARDRLDDLLPIAERACTNAETLALTTLQGADADPRRIHSPPASPHPPRHPLSPA